MRSIFGGRSGHVARDGIHVQHAGLDALPSITAFARRGMTMRVRAHRVVWAPKTGQERRPQNQEQAMEVTRTLARYVVDSRYHDVPGPVRAEAVRSIMNWLGCAVGAAKHETMD